ncbi:MAG: peptide chain release factor 2 [bacterium]
MKETIQTINRLRDKIAETWRLLDLDKKKIEIGNWKLEISREGFWNDQEKARDVTQKLAGLEEEVGQWEELKKEADELLELANLTWNDAKMEDEIKVKLEILENQFGKLEFFVLFDGKYDNSNAIISIHAGTGGVDAQDWAEMLLRMILRFCEKKKFKTKIIDEIKGGEAGIKSATVEVTGNYAYGWLRSEAGVHRLVRISPFDAEKMRHTSFALIEVVPEFPETGAVEINPEEIRIDTYMSGGHGGQSVNTTYSAVRVVHSPTGITVTCQNERSQQQNKETALKILRSKLLKLRMEEREQEIREAKGDYLKAQWGNQIRSYVLQPYKQVKDHRTNFVRKEPDKVLDGELDGFVEEYLKRIKIQN